MNRLDSPHAIPWGFRYEPFCHYGSGLVPDAKLLNNCSTEQLIDKFKTYDPEFAAIVRSKNLLHREDITLDEALGEENLSPLNPLLEALFTLTYGLAEKPYDNLMQIDLRSREPDLVIPQMIIKPAQIVLPRPRQEYFTSRYLRAA